MNKRLECFISYIGLKTKSEDISTKEADITKDFTPIPAAKIMRHQIDQVFINIISNGLDTLKNKWGDNVLDKAQFTISTGQKDGGIFISFKDNGEGISEEEKAKVFDPFFTTKDVGSGIGLGLSISYGIVEEHDGRIELNSRVGEGAEFLVWLPI